MISTTTKNYDKLDNVKFEALSCKFVQFSFSKQVLGSFLKDHALIKSNLRLSQLSENLSELVVKKKIERNKRVRKIEKDKLSSLQIYKRNCFV